MVYLNNLSIPTETGPTWDGVALQMGIQSTYSLMEWRKKSGIGKATV